MAIPEDKTYTEAYLHRSGWKKKNGVWWTNPTLEPGETNYAGAVHAQKRDDERLRGGSIGSGVLERRHGGAKDALPAPIPVCDAQVDTDAAELANAYKTQGEAAARRLWAEKIKGLNYGQQIILQDKMAKLVKAKATDATQVPGGFAAGKSPEFRAAECARRQTELRNLGPLRRPLPGRATDAARLHRALDAVLDAVLDARAKGGDTQFSTGERKETPAELAWRAATYEKREEMLKRAGLPDFESGHGWTLLPVDVRKKLSRLYK